MLIHDKDQIYCPIQKMNLRSLYAQSTHVGEGYSGNHTGGGGGGGGEIEGGGGIQM